jgi:hypothetical protein
MPVAHRRHSATATVTLDAPLADAHHHNLPVDWAQVRGQLRQMARRPIQPLNQPFAVLTADQMLPCSQIVSQMKMSQPLSSSQVTGTSAGQRLPDRHERCLGLDRFTDEAGAWANRRSNAPPARTNAQRIERVADTVPPVRA